LDWSVCWPKGKAKCFWNWPGKKNLMPLIPMFPPTSSNWFILETLPQKYIDMTASLEGLSPRVPLYKVTEGNEPFFFTTYFSWDWDYTRAKVCP
jgi:hypothetical protein